jgi:hypothetical protein
VPTVKVLVVHTAILLLPDPASATEAQPVIADPPSVKLTPPVGADPVTVAVKVTFAPCNPGSALVASVIAVTAGG